MSRSLSVVLLALAGCDPNIPIGNYAVDAGPAHECGAPGGGPRLDASTAGGAWQTQRNHLYAVGGRPTGPLYVGGEGGVILHSTDTDDWTAQPSGTTDAITGVWVADSGEAFATTRGAHVLYSTGDGRWFVDHTVAAGELHGIWGRSATDVWAVGTAGKILHRDASRTWRDVDGATVADLESVWGPPSDTRVYLVGDRATVRLYDAATQRAIALPTGGGSAHLRSVWGTGLGDVYAVGDAAILHSSDGQSFQVELVADVARLTSVTGTGSADVWVAGAAGTVLHRADGTWTRESVGSTADLFGLFVGVGVGAYVVGQHGLLLHRP